MALILPPNVPTDKGIAALLTLSLTIFLLFLIRLKRKHGDEKQLLPLPPGPPGLPILGNLPFLKPDLHRYFAGLARSYGHVFSLRLGSKLCVVISSPSAAREIFKDQDAAFANHVVPAAAFFYFGNSNLDMLWAPNGKHWRTLRKIAVREMLSSSSIEALSPLRCREMRRTVGAVWHQANLGEAVEVRETAFLTILNMTTSMLWGEPVSGSGEGKEFRRAIEGLVDLFSAPNVGDFFPVVAPLDLQGLGRRMRKLSEWINKYLEEIAEKKKEKMASGERSRDVLEALLDIVEEGNPQEPFTMDDLFKLMVDIIGGATDNATTVIEWSMAELLNDPKKMKIAEQELDDVVGKQRNVEESDIPQLSYLSAVVKESLRLHPPAPLLIPHCPSSHCTVGGFSVPAGTTVLINVWGIHRDPNLWGEDAEEFKPERHLKGIKENSDFHLGGNDQFYYMPFGAGRRVCVGIAMAEKMVIYTLASLLHSFEWGLQEGALLQLREKFGTILRKAEELVAVPAVRLDKPELYNSHKYDGSCHTPSTTSTFAATYFKKAWKTSIVQEASPNVDRGWGVGGIFRDENGICCTYFATPCLANSPIEAEIIIVLAALQTAISVNLKNLILETDSEILYNMLSDRLIPLWHATILFKPWDRLFGNYSTAAEVLYKLLMSWGSFSSSPCFLGSARWKFMSGQAMICFLHGVTAPSLDCDFLPICPLPVMLHSWSIHDPSSIAAMSSPSSASTSLSPSTVIQFLTSPIPSITLFTFFLLTFARYIIIRNLPQTNPLPPGPRRLPLLGNLSLLLLPNLHHRLARLSLTYGPIMHLRVGTKLWIVISSPKIAKQIFTENDVDFSDHEQPIAAAVISYGGANLVRCPYGPTWRMLRRVFVHELVNAKSMADAAMELRRSAMKRAVRGIWARGRGGVAINVGELAFEVSLNMLMSMLCGDVKSVGWRDGGKEFRRVMKETVELLGRQNVSDYFPVISGFDLQGIKREMMKRVAWLDRVYEDMIEERMKLRECRVGEDGGGGSGEEKKDLLWKLLKIRDGEEPRVRLSHIQLKALIMDFLVGGTTGTWTTIEWLMAELMHRPETYHRALNELDTVVGRRRTVEESDIPHLPYLRSLIKETLRRHSVIPLLVPRVPSRPITVAGYLIPAGARVVTNVWAIQNDPQVWHEPHEFRPERFLDGGEGEGVAGGFGFFPFGAGRRKCAGLPLAERMLPFVAASLLHLFEWRMGEGVDMKGRTGVTLTKEKPLVALAVARFPACKEMYE
ncbi:uncharacterized protein LOC110039303 [Phalaenopsis equestris]|uniref:uncharacterized protein LOC110039303 n=1 Tax=Phalaenopsis equestris TaxID=78828 RepID=UPI0009E4B09D|nr:uncharacterized protein LOC110039303 [Phalaenopsis equestris]